MDRWIALKKLPAMACAEDPFLLGSYSELFHVGYSFPYAHDSHFVLFVLGL